MKNYKNFINFKYNLSTSQILSISDYVITHPYSSIIYESLNLDKVTFIYAGDNNFVHSDKEYSKISNKINIKYKFNLLDNDILDKYKIKSKISLATNKMANKDKYFNKVYEYLEK